MSISITLSPEPVRVNFTPFAQAKMSDGLFHSSENYQSPDTKLLNYFLYCASIELGLKASILSRNNSTGQKSAVRKIGHDLEKAYQKFCDELPGEDLLAQTEIEAIRKINPFFRSKGIEYITNDVIVELMKGLEAFPSLPEIRTTAMKINDFLKQYKFYINC